jgi:hypothetical protein
MKTICYFDEYHYRANGLFTYTNYYKEQLKGYNKHCTSYKKTIDVYSKKH